MTKAKKLHQIKLICDGLVWVFVYAAALYTRGAIGTNMLTALFVLTVTGSAASSSIEEYLKGAIR